MQEPNSITGINTGAGLFALASFALGPLLGEYAIIVGMGLLGTLMALSESAQPTILKSVIFVLRGVTLSFVFTGITTFLLLKYVLPSDLGLTPYAIMSAVSFFIGWYSDKTSAIRDTIFSKIISLIPSKKEQE